MLDAAHAFAARSGSRKQLCSSEDSLRLIPTKVHGVLDYGLGTLLVLAPWLLGFAELVWAPQLRFGLLELGTA